MEKFAPLECEAESGRVDISSQIRQSFEFHRSNVTQSHVSFEEEHGLQRHVLKHAGFDGARGTFRNIFEPYREYAETLGHAYQ